MAKFRFNNMAQRRGSSIVEVLLAVGIASIVVASVGNLIVSVNRIDRLSAHQDQALGYAREAVDMIAVIAQDEFQCTGSCGCTPLPGYTSCWQSCPVSGCSGTFYQLSETSGSWHLISGTESLGTSPNYTRKITLTDLDGNTATKQVGVTVEWSERGQTKSVKQDVIVSGWKN